LFALGGAAGPVFPPRGPGSRVMTAESAAQEGRGQLTAPLLSAIRTSLSALGLPLPIFFAEKLQKMIEILQQAIAF
jgi:hypothetical protein